jgi:hypothetical protein
VAFHSPRQFRSRADPLYEQTAIGIEHHFDHGGIVERRDNRRPQRRAQIVDQSPPRLRPSVSRHSLSVSKSYGLMCGHPNQ